MLATAALLALAGSALAIPLHGNFTLEKRVFNNARFTWYDVDVAYGSCGTLNKDTDMVVALNQEQWNNKAYCYDYVTIWYGSHTLTAQIVDLCSGCPYGALDLSPGVYDALTYPGAHGTDLAPGGPLYGSWDWASGPSAPPPPPPPSGGGNRIHPNGDSSKCLDVQGGKFANGTPVQIYDCNGTGAQNWVIHSATTALQVAGTNYCLDAGTTPGSGTQMKIWECFSGIPAQTWYYTSDKRISLGTTPQNKGQCLDLTNGSKNDGTVMQIWACTTGNTNQIWTLS